MDKKKEVQLKKYLEKKRKQKTRDELLDQIATFTNTPSNNTIRSIKKKIKKKKKLSNDFEKSLIDIVEEPYVDQTIADTYFEEGLQLNSAINISPVQINDFSVSEDVVEPKYKEELLSKQETFVTARCLNRLSQIQQQRMKLDIFYEETEIVSIIKYNLITFIQGNTGCGKTTQIPQFLFENGFTSSGIIAITQPRRFSAISISSRINEEMNENYSAYKIKYENNITENTKIKVMTEGVLFKEIQSDFLLNSYSVIVLDEVHERSTNSDVLVGLLSKIVKVRLNKKNPLRLMLMSATIDPTIYNKVLGEYAIINLKQKVHEISIFYENKDVENYVEGAYCKILAILQSEKCYKNNKKAVRSLSKIPDTITNDVNASILVFLASKEDIFVLKDKLELYNKDVVVLPLYSGLNKIEQAKVYENYPTRKIVLATNIAETSVTIDGIVFVIDCGRVKRKITNQNIVLYNIGYISKSSACQRSGRCGRTCPGVCYRIYSGERYESFPEQNMPQILTELFDSTFLQLKGMGINNIFGFPFVDQPSQEDIKASIRSLTCLGALNNEGNLHILGKDMCSYPLIPRLSKLIIKTLISNDIIFAKMCLIVSILSCNFEYKRNEKTEEFYNSSKSDLVVAMKIMIKYITSRNKRMYASGLGISVESCEMILKMTYYLMAISKKGSAKNILENGEDDEDTICKLLFYAYSDQLAINNGSNFMSGGGEIFASTNSIKTEGANFVFDHIICGTKNSWAVGITLVNRLWYN